MFTSALLLASLLGTISVTVTDQASAPLPGATVEVLRDGVIEQRGFSSSSGVAEFALVAPGRYLVRVFLDGFQRGESEVEVLPRVTSSAQLNLAIDDLSWYWLLTGEFHAPVVVECPMVVPPPTTP